MEYAQIALLAEKLKKNIGKVIVGNEDKIELILTAMLAGGHVLLEDVPGTGKTTMAKSLAKSLSCDFSRIQFTPDLLPSDITGTRIYDRENNTFTFVKGPAFTNILLADEINRATPRTQSALLECMEERQITEGGITYTLAEPFLVIATQNPVETQGTFKLPEAQLDRFLIQLALGYPDKNETIRLMERFIHDKPLEELQPVAEAAQIVEAAKLCTRCQVSKDIMRYMAAVCDAARSPDKVRLGPSPRALLALMRCCQALAAIRGRDYVIPDDVKELAVPVLAHRIMMRSVGSSADSADFVRSVLNGVRAPTENEHR
ncbi:MAG: MoxR family ATPase [Oscillospiraceae bacterium]|nr:MoxR family ATPase [Oscillospiraceae bacterium]